MGLCGKVTLFVIIVFIQISCRHCMPRTPIKSSLKRYLNNLNNPNYSPTRTSNHLLEKAGHYQNNVQHSSPSIYEAYNFPENEYPLDTAPRNPFHHEMNFNRNNPVNKPYLIDNRSLHNSATNNFKKKLKMQRKLASYRQNNAENYHSKREISPTKFGSEPDSINLLGSGIFPEVQYPLNAMETWGPNHWDNLPFTKHEKQLNAFGQSTPNSKARDVSEKSSKLSKAKASRFLKPYHILKEENKRVLSDSSKRSSVDIIYYKKSPMCEKLLEDFITESIVSSISSTSSDVKNMIKSILDETPNTKHAFQESAPAKVFEEHTQQACAVFDQYNNTEINDMNETMGTKILQSNYSDMCTKEPNTVVLDNINADKTMNISRHPGTTIPSNIDVLLPVTNSSKSCANPTEDITQNDSSVAGPLNVKIPFPATNPINVSPSISNLNDTALLSNTNGVPGTTSIIIIPIHNAVGKSLSQSSQTTPDTSIIVYTTQPGSNPVQNVPFNHYLPSILQQIIHNSSQSLSFDRYELSALENNVSQKNQSDLSDMVPLLCNKTSTTDFISEMPTNIFNNASLLQNYETLPANSMCYKIVKGPSPSKGTFSGSNTTNKALTDTISSDTPTCDIRVNEHSIETCNTHINSETMSPYFEHSALNFINSTDLYLLAAEPQNNINELPKLIREVNEDHLTNDSFAYLNIEKNSTTHDISTDRPEIQYNSLTKQTDNNLSTDTSISSVETLNNDMPAPTVTSSSLFMDELHMLNNKTPTPSSLSKGPDETIILSKPKVVPTIQHGEDNTTENITLLTTKTHPVTPSDGTLKINEDLSPVANIDNLLVQPLNNSLSTIQRTKTDKSTQLFFPRNETIEPIPTFENNTERLPIDPTLSLTDPNIPADKLSLLEKNITSKTHFTKINTNNQQLPIKKTQSIAPLLSNQLPQYFSTPNTSTEDVASSINKTVPQSSDLQKYSDQTSQLMDGPLLRPTPDLDSSTNELLQPSGKNNPPTSSSITESTSTDDKISMFTNSSDYSINQNIFSNQVSDKSTNNNNITSLARIDNPLSHIVNESLPSDNTTNPIHNTYLETPVLSNSLPKSSSKTHEELEVLNVTNDSNLLPIVDSPIPVSSTFLDTDISKANTNEVQVTTSLGDILDNNLSESMIESTDFEPNNMTEQLHDSHPINEYLDDGHIPVEVSLLPMNISEQGQPDQKNDSQSTIDNVVQSTSKNDTAPLSVNEDVPHFFDPNTDSHLLNNDAPLPLSGEIVFSEVPLGTVDLEHQTSPINDLIPPTMLTTDSPKIDTITNISNILLLKEDERFSKSPIPSNFQGSSVSNISCDLPSEKTNALLLDIDNDVVQLNKTISGSSLYDETEDLSSMSIQDVLSESNSTSNDSTFTINKKSSVTPLSGLSDNSMPIFLSKTLPLVSIYKL